MIFIVFILFYFILFHFISFYFILFHFISFYFISFHFISFFFIPFFHSFLTPPPSRCNPICQYLRLPPVGGDEEDEGAQGGTLPATPYMDYQKVEVVLVQIKVCWEGGKEGRKEGGRREEKKGEGGGNILLLCFILFYLFVYLFFFIIFLGRY